MRTISSECLSFAPLALLGISQNTYFQGEHATETIHGISCKLKGFGGSTVCCYRLLLPFAESLPVTPLLRRLLVVSFPLFRRLFS